MTIKATVATAAARAARAYVRHVPVAALKPLLLRRLIEPALRRHPVRFVTETLDGVRIGGTTRDMIERYVYVFGVWEPDITAWMRPRLLEGRTLVDVGANIGYFTLLGSRLVGTTGQVVAVEALPETFVRLQDNLTMNRSENVRALNLAAAAEEGVLTLFGGESHNRGTTTTVPSDDLVEIDQVEAVPLADVLTPTEIATVRLIKIDVEGGEMDVLRGLAPIIEDAPDDVELVVEVSPQELRRAGERPDAPIELLAGYGFVPYRIDNDYALVSYIERDRSAVPRRFTGPSEERMDLVFSRIDAPALP